MDEQHRRDTARKIEIGTSIAAGSVGAALGATKLRDAYKEDYPAAWKSAGKTGRRMVGSRAAHFIGHAKPGFKPLAAGTATAVVATAASKYRQKKDHEDARRHVAKADIPMWGHVKGIGRVRVMHYHRNGHFMVMDRADTQRLVHRDKITFMRPKVKVAKSFAADELGDIQDANARARKVKAKVVPPKVMIARRIGTGTARLKQEWQQDLQKSAGQPRRAVPFVA